MAFKLTITRENETINMENGESIQESSQLLEALRIAIGTPQPIEWGLSEEFLNEVSKFPEEEASTVVEEELPKPVEKEEPKETTETTAFGHATHTGPKKQVELLGSKTTGFPIAEKLKTDVPVDAATLKVPLGSVQIYVNHKECGYAGDWHTLPFNKYVKCPYCKEKLFLEQTCHERGEADENGDVFIAAKKYKTREELWEEKQDKE